MSSAAVDASAIIALLALERGHERVQAAIDAGAYLSSVNLSEIVAKLHERGDSGSRIRTMLAVLRVTVVPFDEELAYRAGLLRGATRSAGLSLGDRACLALAERLGLPAVTADRSWAALGLPIQVDVIR